MSLYDQLLETFSFKFTFSNRSFLRYLRRIYPYNTVMHCNTDRINRQKQSRVNDGTGNHAVCFFTHAWNPVLCERGFEMLMQDVEILHDASNCNSRDLVLRALFPLSLTQSQVPSILPSHNSVFFWGMQKKTVGCMFEVCNEALERKFQFVWLCGHDHKLFFAVIGVLSVWGMQRSCRMSDLSVWGMKGS